MEGNSVTHWFGEHVTELHPLLQRLHREGGELTGEVEVRYGQGLAGLLGRRLAAKLGLPAASRRCEMHVDIRHSAAGLFWNRRFAGGQSMLHLRASWALPRRLLAGEHRQTVRGAGRADHRRRLALAAAAHAVPWLPPTKLADATLRSL